MSETTPWDAIEVGEDFAIGYRLTNPYAMDFAVVMVVGHQQGDTAAFDVPVYEEQSDDAAVEFTPDIYKALPFAAGFVKWDGCSHWTFGEPACMTHIMCRACGRLRAKARRANAGRS